MRKNSWKNRIVLPALMLACLLTGCGEETRQTVPDLADTGLVTTSGQTGSADPAENMESTGSTDTQASTGSTDSTDTPGCTAGSGTTETTETAEPGPEDLGYLQITMDDAVWMLQNRNDYILLDVRTHGEFLEGHIPGAINIDSEDILAIQDLNQEIKKLPDKDQKILIYCRSGNRSKKAAAKLAEMGYTRIIEFGGIIDWPGEVVTDN